MSLLTQTFIVIQCVCAAAILEYLLESASICKHASKYY